MNRIIWLLVLALSAANFLHGQHLLHPQHLIATDLSALAQRSLGFRYEFQPNAYNGWEVEYSLRRCTDLPDNIFHGDMNRYFGQRRTDTVVVWSNQNLNQTDWMYLEDSRPLAPVPEFIPLETTWVGLNYTALFPKRAQRWFFFVKPGIFVGNHRYYRVRDYLTLIGEDLTVVLVQQYPTMIQARTRTILYQQRREMRQTDALTFGAGLQAGVRWMPVRRVVLEVRGSVFLNGQPPHPNATGLAVSALATRISWSMGFVFGKKLRPVVQKAGVIELTQ